MKIAIAHAAWMPERERTWQRLVDILHHGDPPGAHERRTFKSDTREHASIWARRLWEFAASHDEGTILLNDDVTVHPKLVDVVTAMAHAVPDTIFSLHCTSPVSPSFAEAGERWLRSYWATGPGIYLSPGAAKRLLAWVDSVPRSFIASTNEDNVIMHWAWHEQRPIWHCIPALVQHDTSTRSSLGYDNQPAWMRSSPVAWTAQEFASDPDIMTYVTDPAWWTPDGDPMIVECPWMVRERLAQVERFLYDRPDLCSFCHQNDGSVASQNTGAKICRVCLIKTVSAAMGGLG